MIQIEDVASVRPKVLVVDDQEVNLELIEAHLAPEGYELRFAHNGSEALQILERENPDLVLLDVMMPGMDGNEVCRRLRQIPGHQTTPVVMITALEDEVDNRLPSIEAGADDFLQKPVVKRELLARVKSLLDRNQVYTSLNRENARLQEAHKLSHDLRHMILHDLGTPISELDMALHLATQRERDRQQARLLQWMSFSTERLNRLTNDLLDLDLLQEGQLPIYRSAIDINELITNELEHLRQHPASQERRIISILDPHLPPVFADPNLIIRTLCNLLNNALKYTPAGSEICVESHALKRHAEIVVNDKGPGIPIEEREAIFEKYHRGRNRRQRKGQGLGLTFCKLAVEAHGGHIWVDGDEGARFHFTLPLVDAR